MKKFFLINMSIMPNVISDAKEIIVFEFRILIKHS